MDESCGMKVYLNGRWLACLYLSLITKIFAGFGASEVPPFCFQAIVSMLCARVVTIVMSVLDKIKER